MFERKVRFLLKKSFFFFILQRKYSCLAYIAPNLYNPNNITNLSTL